MGKRSTCMEFHIDLVYEILLNLPVKTLHRFFCVCKTWYHLLSQPSFQNDHYHRRSQQDPLLLVTKYDDRADRLTLSVYNSERVHLHDFSIPALKSYNIITVLNLIQSCRGLVCIAPIYKAPVLVCNPSTKDVIALPQPQEGDIRFSCRCVGFGFAASVQKFKIVRFVSRFKEDNDKVLSCEIFTLGAGEGWIEARTPPAYWPHWDAPLLHGAIHLMPSEENLHYQVNDHYIAAFDLDTEKYKSVPLPEIYFGEARFLAESTYFVYLLEIKGSLCLTFDYSETEKKLLELWVLKDYTSGNWVKKYSIVLSSMVQQLWASPITIISDGSILIFFDYGTETQLRCYNPRENCFADTIGSSCWANHYVESLFNLGKQRAIQIEEQMAMSKGQVGTVPDAPVWRSVSGK